MKTRTLDYRDGELECQGFLAEPEGQGPFPAVLVVHEAPGLLDHPKRRARMLAELGYVALAADMYGGGAGPIADREQSMARMMALSDDRPALRRRAMAALQALRSLPHVDQARIAAIGYCFGGSTVLELARMGTELAGVASFHGALGTSTPAEPGAIKARMLICTGYEDPMIPPEACVAAQDEFTRGGADWQMIVYSGVAHAFTNRDAPQMPGFGYDADADRRSWQALRNFLDEIFA